MRIGLSHAEARALSMEEVLCLLHHAQLDEKLAALDGEAARIAGLQLADPHEQQQALAILRHGVEAELDRFYRGDSHTGDKARK